MDSNFIHSQPPAQYSSYDGFENQQILHNSSTMNNNHEAPQVKHEEAENGGNYCQPFLNQGNQIDDQFYANYHHHQHAPAPLHQADHLGQFPPADPAQHFQGFVGSNGHLMHHGHHGQVRGQRKII